MTEIPTIEHAALASVYGGGAWNTAKYYGGKAWDAAKYVGNVAKETFGYAGPHATSDLAGVPEAGGKALMLGPQGNARNDLIRSLASEGSGRQADRAFDRYHNGPGQRLAAAAQ